MTIANRSDIISALKGGEIDEVVVKTDAYGEYKLEITRGGRFVQDPVPLDHGAATDILFALDAPSANGSGTIQDFATTIEGSTFTGNVTYGAVRQGDIYFLIRRTP